MILGHTVLAFQISVPAGGFSLKMKNQRNTLRFHIRILCKRRKKKRNNEPGAHHYGVSSWRSRLGILSKNMINNKKQIRRRKASKTKTRTVLQPQAFFRKNACGCRTVAPAAIAGKANKEGKTKKRTVLQPQAFCEQKAPVAAERLSFF